MCTFPNYVNGYVLPNRVVILGTLSFSVKLGFVLRLDLSSIAGRLGKYLKIVGLRSDFMREVRTNNNVLFR